MAATPAASTLLYDGYVADSVTSADGLTVYVACADGAVRAYNAETGALLTSWAVGKALGGIAISPDDGFLIVTETKALGHQGDGWDTKTKVVTYQIDLASGTVTDHPVTVTGYGDAFLDVAILADGRAYLTQSFRGSGHTPIWALDPTTGKYETVFDQSFYMASLTTDGDRTKLAISINNLSSSNSYIYDVNGTKVAQGYDSENGYGIQAYSQEAGLYAQYTQGGLSVYDSSLKLIRVLSEKLKDLYYTTGVAFDATGANLYAVDSLHETIVQVDTATWKVVQTIALPKGAFTFNLGLGEELIVGADGRYFLIYAGGQYLRIDNPMLADAIAGTEDGNVLAGTAAADTMLGFGGNDRLSASDGDDLLNGGTGADRMAGGAGNDRYIVDDRGDKIAELAGGGHDHVTSSVTFRLSADVEDLTLVGQARVNGTGNALDNFITGNDAANALEGGGGADILVGGAGDDRLDGGTGSDRMEGGAGNDRYVVDDAGDTAVELEGGGSDEVQSSIDYRLGFTLENLTLAGTARLGTGNAGTNEIEGNARGNELAGLGGDDRLFGRDGNDVLNGGDGDDNLYGGTGKDTLSGGAGKDVFHFAEAGVARTLAEADTVTDFNQVDKDKLDLSDTDGVAGYERVDPFVFVGTAEFSGRAGDLRYEFVGKNTIVSADTDSDRIADVFIRLEGRIALTAKDFVFARVPDDALASDTGFDIVSADRWASRPLDLHSELGHLSLV